MEKEVEELAGEKGKHDKERIAHRHGKEQTKVVMGGKKAAVGKPRVRAKGGSGEIALDTLSLFQKEDPLDDAAPSRLLAGASTRKCALGTAGWASQRVKHGQERGVPQVQGRHGNSDGGILRLQNIWRISNTCAWRDAVGENNHCGCYGD
ncbi:MAG: hypothetical protein FWG10_12635 [Eubacteriaceae bacterium]|nr:hypothetical protein [Eubacteriaceae bacterium]